MHDSSTCSSRSEARFVIRGVPHSVHKQHTRAKGERPIGAVAPGAAAARDRLSGGGRSPFARDPLADPARAQRVPETRAITRRRRHRRGYRRGCCWGYRRGYRAVGTLAPHR